jgi:hypothetical protein
LKSLAFIGRNDDGKGLSNLILAFKTLTDFPLVLHVFSDSIDFVAPNVIWHGWVSRDEIWSTAFDYVCLPMTAPETYCFALHEAVKHDKGIIVNGDNQSLTSQILSGAKTYYGNDDLRTVLINLASENTKDPRFVVLQRKKSIWRKI